MDSAVSSSNFILTFSNIFLGPHALEIFGTTAGVLGLILLAQEKRVGWLIGMIWSAISAYLAFFSWSLLSDAIMYLVYLPIQLYCWHSWNSQPQQGNTDELVPTWLPRRTQLILLGSTVACIVMWATIVDTQASKVSWLPVPAMLWRDSATTVLNFFAQLLMAKKRMENWIYWVIVNVMGIQIYYLQGSTIYALQYGLFLLLGLYGWWKWHQHRRRVAASLHGAAVPAAS